MVLIDRSSPVPYYHQLREALEARIGNGDFPVDAQLPGEYTLCEQYGVSRAVVRQALSDLEASGLVVRRKGKGTFVAGPKTDQGLVQSLRGLFDDVRAHGQDLYSRVLFLGRAQPAPAIARLLELAPGQEVVLLERIRYVDGDPWVVTTSHLPLPFAEPLLRMDFSRRSLYETLESELGARMTRARRTVEAVRAGETLARQLGVAEGAAILLLKSLTHADDGRPMEYFVAWHRGDRSRFEVTLERTAPAVRPGLVVADAPGATEFPAMLPGERPAVGGVR